MITPIHRTIGLAALTLFFTAMAGRAEILDGTKWKIHVEPRPATAEKGEKSYDDELVLANSQFTSTAHLAKGFQTAAYTADDEGYEIEFEAVLVSEAEGRATWSGGVKNREISGKLECIKKDGSKLLYVFTGTRE